jgi:5-(carboxyamino)imidazole ribonucleotide synthase
VSIPFDSSPTVAIIGAGQLGFLLCEAAHNIGIKTIVITPDASSPAITVAGASIVASLEDPLLAEHIAECADVVTFEFEDVPDSLLEALHVLEQRGSLRIHPAVGVLRLLKNKARQKSWFQDHGFPSLAYKEISSEQAADANFIAELPLPFVQKAQEGGYDGYGVQIISTIEDQVNVWPIPSIIETFLREPHELAVVTVRSITGETIAYPPVELAVDQSRNILDAVIAPARLSPAVNEQAMTLASSVARELGGVGVFAVEMFLLEDGQLLINEVSPRVHNSGHHTLESCAASQFEQHMRAVSGLSLASSKQISPSVMKNVLYDDSMAPLVGLKPGKLIVDDKSINVHWYGKLEGRPGRKMGHITCLSNDPAEAQKNIDKALADLCLSQGD